MRNRCRLGVNFRAEFFSRFVRAIPDGVTQRQRRQSWARIHVEMLTLFTPYDTVGPRDAVKHVSRFEAETIFCGAAKRTGNLFEFDFVGRISVQGEASMDGVSV